MLMQIFQPKISIGAAELNFWEKKLYELVISNTYDVCYSQIYYWFAEPLQPWQQGLWLGVCLVTQIL